MEYREFRRHLGKARLTVKQFAELVNLNRNSITNYSRKGTVPTTLAIISALLGEMAERNVDFFEILSRIDTTPNKPRGSGFRRREDSDDLEFKK